MYTGETDENKIMQMTYTFFMRVLKQLGRKLKYDASVCYAGNSFFEKSNELINESNPLTEDASENLATYGERMANMLNFSGIKIRDRKDGEKDQVAEKYGLQFG